MRNRTLAMRGLRAMAIRMMALLMALGVLGTGVVAQEEQEGVGETEEHREPTYEGPQPVGALLLPDAPPGVGTVVFEDMLNAPRVVPPGRCPTQRAVIEYVGEGLIFKVSGRCLETSTFASVARNLPRLTVPDGEVRVEAKVVSGHDRAGMSLLIRQQAPSNDAYNLFVYPARGMSRLSRFVDGQRTVLAERTDLVGRIAVDDWNELAIRLRGPDLWALLNGEPILSASDPMFSSGGVQLGLQRTGPVDDDSESAVVFRNLRVSRLAPNS